MDNQLAPPISRVKATLNLGLETYSVSSTSGNLVSEQIISMKEECMRILKEFITKHNVPNDVPDEAVEGSSADEDEDETPEKPLKKRK
ncbi:hypothetical protein GIB67_040662 [Kingdonia uniflora]|uniref:Uncharacterized protein n=1 Tax=Kingdonia uniflora TaxID=39325 RepID=A0A7J7KU78_9MAGN|nr:hypothetical protein GIB67_040662 [Kingdonia uniflora]